MPEPTLEFVKRQLDLEEQSEPLLQLPADFYSRVTVYARNLRRSMGSSNAEVTNRLIQRQFKILEGTIGRLVKLRMAKATSRDSISGLLPEEKYVCLLGESYKTELVTFITAISSGQSSYLEMAHRAETNRNVVLRFTKPVSEIVGVDLRKYGPYRPNDLASIPVANADILVANDEAVRVNSRTT